MALLVVNSLRKVFGKTWWPFGKDNTFTAVDDISLTLDEGEVLGMLGANGAGKTTTTHMLLGTLTPTSGTIEYFGKSFRKHRSEILQHVSFASTYVKLPGRLSVWENLDIFGRLYGISYNDRIERIEKFLKFFDMWQFRNKDTGVLSAGQITRVMLAKAFIPNPKVVLLDEPTASLDPDVAYEVRQFIITQKRERGIGVLFTSHNMDEVALVCDRVLMMAGGKIIAQGTPHQLAASVATARVHFTITSGMEGVIQFAHNEEYSYVADRDTITLEVDEHDVARLLSGFARNGIEYSHISIDKPTLEDYFLSVTKEYKPRTNLKRA